MKSFLVHSRRWVKSLLSLSLGFWEEAMMPLPASGFPSVMSSRVCSFSFSPVRSSPLCFWFVFSVNSLSVPFFVCVCPLLVRLPPPSSVSLWPSLAFIKPEDNLCFLEKKQGNESLLPWFLVFWVCLFFSRLPPAQDEDDGSKGMMCCWLNGSSLWFFSFFRFSCPSVFFFPLCSFFSVCSLHLFCFLSLAL